MGRRRRQSARSSDYRVDLHPGLSPKARKGPFGIGTQRGPACPPPTRPAYSTNLVSSGQEDPPPVLAETLDTAVRLCHTNGMQIQSAEKRKASRKRYDDSPKGKARRERYESTEKAQARRQRYEDAHPERKERWSVGLRSYKERSA